MIFDARSLEADTELAADVCIIGAGAAGITLARELSSAGIETLVFESGGIDYEDASQALYQGSSVGDRYPDLDTGRVRALGGSTNHWGGNCSPLGPLDFAVRPWVDHSGWPIERAVLDPYYRRAQRYVELGPSRFDADFWAETTQNELLQFDDGKLQTGIAQGSSTNFGERYRDDLDASARVRLFLHANLLSVELAADAGSVDHLRLGVLGGDRFTARAKSYVLSMGGIENPRMLLVSNSVMPNGVGNQNDLVGRFFMDHPVIEGAVVLTARMADAAFYYDNWEGPGYRVHGFLEFTDDFVRAEKLMNVRMPLLDVSRYYLSEGISSFHSLGRAIGRGDWPDDLFEHIGNMIGDIDLVAEAVARKAFETSIIDDADAFGGFLIDAMIEQSPNPDSRVRLGEERDALGLRRVELDWRLQMRDRENLVRCYKLLAAEVGRTGFGRLRMILDLDDEDRFFTELVSYAHHHMGATRAHADPKQGVVDADLRVHGVDNLYVAGSSVFPTGGHVPPTLTIVTLAIRLADHLASRATTGA